VLKQIEERGVIFKALHVAENPRVGRLNDDGLVIPKQFVGLMIGE
jgi:hypothetical protein